VTDELCALPLRILLLNNNRLQRLPAKIHQLRATLIELVSEHVAGGQQLCVQDVSCNRLDELPAELGYLHSLRILNLCDNSLHVLPAGEWWAD
jgi:Leucine-rich repeat (LRR) protein